MRKALKIIPAVAAAVLMAVSAASAQEGRAYQIRVYPDGHTVCFDVGVNCYIIVNET